MNYCQFQFILNKDEDIWPWTPNWPALPWTNELGNLKKGDIVELDWKPETFTVRVKKEFRVINIEVAYPDLDSFTCEYTIEVECVDKDGFLMMPTKTLPHININNIV